MAHAVTNKAWLYSSVHILHNDTAILSLSTHHKLIPNTDKDFLFSTAPTRLGLSIQWIPWLFPYE